MPDKPETRLEALATQVQTNTSQIAQQSPAPHVDITPIEYAFFGVLLLMSAGIIGWFIKSSFKDLTDSNTELKNSIEKLATLASTIHSDLLDYKAEVAENYATKKDLAGLKKDIKDTCVLRHERSRRADDEDEDGEEDGMGL